MEIVRETTETGVFDAPGWLRPPSSRSEWTLSWVLVACNVATVAVNARLLPML
jgi:hypothetical protein